MDLNRLLHTAVDRGASDVHLKVGQPPMIRFDGELQPLEGWPTLDTDAARGDPATRSAPRSRAARDVRGAPASSTLAYQRPGLPRFRVNAFRQRGDISFAFRVIPSEVPSFERAAAAAGRRAARRGAPRPRPRHRRHRRRQDDDARGDASATSTARAGSTSSRSRIRSRSCTPTPSCIVNQREVGLDTGSFHEALRRVLRQDPDIILIGELRDAETAETALQAAESGHLVLLDDAHRRRVRDRRPPGRVLPGDQAAAGALDPRRRPQGRRQPAAPSARRRRPRRRRRGDDHEQPHRRADPREQARVHLARRSPTARSSRCRRSRTR